MTSEDAPRRVYFFAGYERWSGTIVAVETRWRDNRLVAAEWVETLPPGALAIRIAKIELEKLLQKEAPYDQGWNGLCGGDRAEGCPHPSAPRQEPRALESPEA